MRNSKCNQAFCILFVKAGKYSKGGQYSSEEKFTHTHTHTHTEGKEEQKHILKQNIHNRKIIEKAEITSIKING